MLINNAGFGLISTIEDAADEEFTRQFDVNVFGVFRLCRAVIPGMRARKSGVIINVSSFLGKMGLPFSSLFSYLPRQTIPRYLRKDQPNLIP